MANTYVTPQVIAKEVLMHMENNLVMGKLVHRDYKKEFVKVGDTVSIRKPVQFTAQDGPTRVDQGITEATTTLQINKDKHVSWSVQARDLTLSINEQAERWYKPAGIALANAIDADLCALYKDVWNAVGTAGTTPTAFTTFAGPAIKLFNHGVPQEKLSLVINPNAFLNAADLLRTLYNPEMVKGAVRGMKVGPIGMMDVYMDQNIQSHTKGGAAGTPLVNGAGQTGASLVTDGWTAATTLVVGDIFTLPNVNSVNPVSRQSTGEVQQFVVTAAGTADGSGNMTISISPSIITTGAYQTVTGSPADNVALTVVANHAANLAFHKNAFALVVCPLEEPQSAAFKQSITENGFSFLMTKDYNINTREEIVRLDILYGVKALDPSLACRLLG